MPIELFDHYTIRAADFDASKTFYAEVMGMQAEVRDELGFSIALMSLGGQAIVHILATGPALDEFLGRDGAAFTDGPGRQTGNMEHVAFNATGLAAIREKLRIAGSHYSERALADYGVHQILVADPDGIEIEINFPIAEAN